MSSTQSRTFSPGFKRLLWLLASLHLLVGIKRLAESFVTPTIYQKDFISPYLMANAILHGDKRIERAVATWGGAANWAEDAELAAARLVIADVNMPLSSLLSCDGRFELVYKDAGAAVFIIRKAIAPAK